MITNIKQFILLERHDIERQREISNIVDLITNTFLTEFKKIKVEYFDTLKNISDSENVTYNYNISEYLKNSILQIKFGDTFYFGCKIKYKNKEFLFTLEYDKSKGYCDRDGSRINITLPNSFYSHIHDNLCVSMDIAYKKIITNLKSFKNGKITSQQLKYLNDRDTSEFEVKWKNKYDYYIRFLNDDDTKELIAHEVNHWLDFSIFTKTNKQSEIFFNDREQLLKYYYNSNEEYNSFLNQFLYDYLKKGNLHNTYKEFEKYFIQTYYKNIKHTSATSDMTKYLTDSNLKKIRKRLYDFYINSKQQK